MYFESRDAVNVGILAESNQGRDLKKYIIHNDSWYATMKNNFKWGTHKILRCSAKNNLLPREGLYLFSKISHISSWQQVEVLNRKLEGALVSHAWNSCMHPFSIMRFDNYQSTCNIKGFDKNDLRDGKTLKKSNTWSHLPSTANTNTGSHHFVEFWGGFHWLGLVCLVWFEVGFT